MNITDLQKISENIFTEFDKDNSNTIDRLELKEILQKLGEKLKIKIPSESLIQEIIESYDENGDGVLQFKEFEPIIFDIFIGSPQQTQLQELEKNGFLDDEVDNFNKILIQQRKLDRKTSVSKAHAKQVYEQIEQLLQQERIEKAKELEKQKKLESQRRISNFYLQRSNVEQTTLNGYTLHTVSIEPQKPAKPQQLQVKDESINISSQSNESLSESDNQMEFSPQEAPRPTPRVSKLFQQTASSKAKQSQDSKQKPIQEQKPNKVLKRGSQQLPISNSNLQHLKRFQSMNLSSRNSFNNLQGIQEKQQQIQPINTQVYKQGKRKSLYPEYLQKK